MIREQDELISLVHPIKFPAYLDIVNSTLFLGFLEP